jgi:hypothetical protein
MYTVKNYQTKKELVADYLSGKKIETFQPGGYFTAGPQSGEAVIEGPHYPQPHRFYVGVTLRDGIIVAIKGVKFVPREGEQTAKPIVKARRRA